MERFEESVTVAAPPSQVWEVLADVRRLPSWLTIAREVHVDEDPGAGQRFEVRGGYRGVSRTVTAHVDTWEPTTSYGWAVDDPLRLRFRYELDGEGDGDGTALRARVDADLSGLPRVATRFAVRSLRREFARSLDQLGELAAR